MATRYEHTPGVPSLDERVARTQQEIRERVEASLRPRTLPAQPPDPPEPARPPWGDAPALAELARSARRACAVAGARLQRSLPPGLVDRARLPRTVGGAGARSWRSSRTLAAAIGLAALVAVLLLASLDGPSARTRPDGALATSVSSRAVAPGGRVELEGSGAGPGARVEIETRVRGGRWRGAGSTLADDDGRFRAAGRVAARPGRLLLRAAAGPRSASPAQALTVRPLRLAAVGDVNLGDLPGEAIERQGPRYPWESVGRPLRAADLAFANLECAVTDRSEPFPKQFNFRATRGALEGLRRHSGIDVLNLANNHVGDYGRDGTRDTLDAVEQLGMRAVGAGDDLERALEPQVVERLGLRVAFVGFSRVAPVEFAAGPDEPGTAWATPESVARAVRAARRRADVVVATFHWGIEKQTLESAEQRMLAQTAVGAGAQLVVGAHPHVLQPVRREGPAVVAYSLGNFVFGAHSTYTSATGVLELGLTAEGVSSARWRPATISAGRPLLERTPPRLLNLGAAETPAGLSLLPGADAPLVPPA